MTSTDITPAERCRELRADIASLADWIESELYKQADDDESTWAEAGSLEHVREQLIETLAAFPGIDIDAIRGCLSE